MSAPSAQEKVARPYQVELLQKAINQNAIVYLGTGAGKTFIATMLIKELMGGILHEGKKTVFLVHRVPLVTQQAKFIGDNTPLTVRSFCGSDNVDFWKEEEWLKEIKKHQVLVMIHDTFKFALNHGYMHMRDVNLLIVDECHHSFGNSTYNQIFKGHYHPLNDACPEEAPRVLGLSASLVTAKVKSIDDFHKMRHELETIMNAKVITTTDLANLLKFATQPNEMTVTYKSGEAYTFVMDEINDGQDRLEKILERKRKSVFQDLLGIPGKQALDDAGNTYKKFKRILSQLEKAIVELGLFHGRELLRLSEEYISEELLVKAEDPFKLQLSKEVRTTIRNLRRHVEALVNEDLCPKVNLYEKYSTDKVKTLVNKLQSFQIFDKDGNEIPMRVIIFVQERMIAVALASFLADVAEMKDMKSKLRVSYAVGGTSSNRFKEPESKALQ